MNASTTHRAASLRGRHQLLGLVLCALVAPGCAPADPQAAAFSQSPASRGFCTDGVLPSTRSARSASTEDRVSWGSHCPGQSGAGELVLTSVASVDGTLSLNIAGYPTNPGIELALRDPRSGERHRLELQTDPRETWKQFSFRLPARWQEGPLELVVRDAVPAGAWIAVSQPATQWAWTPRPTLVLLLAVFFHGTLLLLPGVGAVLGLRRFTRFARFGIESPLAPLIVAPAVLGYIAFWAYWIDPLLGKGFSLVVYGVSLALLGLEIRSLGTTGLGRLLQHHAVQTLLLMTLVVIFYVWAAFMWGGEDTPFRTIASRYSHTLPLDNMIPMLLANGVYNGEIPKPFFSAWLSSDRPPLQAGLFVLQRPVIEAVQFVGDKLHYEIASLWFQATWIPALVWLLRRARVDARLVAWILAATVFSGFALVNTTYVWPKLLPTALLLFPTAALVFEPTESWKTSNAWGVFAGLCAALAMLGHGGSSFALMGIGVSALVLRRIPRLRVTGIVIAAALLSHLPWNAYQSFVDPPGSRLIKIHLAGTGAMDGRSVLEAISEEYSRLDASEILRRKKENFAFPARDLAGTAGSLLELVNPWSGADRRLTTSTVREHMFHQIFHALGVLNLGFLALPWLARKKARANRDARLALRSIGVASATLVVWCLMMFGPATTAINHGSYFAPLMLFVGTTAALFALHRNVTAVCVSAHVILTAYLYAEPNPSLLPPSTRGAVGYAASDGIMIAAAVCAGLAVLWMLALQARKKALVRE